MNSVSRNLVSAASALVFCALLLTGCGAGVSPTTPVTASPLALSGRVYGGQQPVTGAVLSLYSAGVSAGGNGTGAVSRLTLPRSTDAQGSFDITLDFLCPSPTAQMYLVARGGNPGMTGPVDNQASVMMAALGDCNTLNANTYIFMNEVTTVAAAWALAQFSAPGAVIGASATNATGLRNAFLVANSLVNTTTGLPGGAGLPASATLETAKIDTLADVLAVCVNSGGGSACNPLFAAATVNGVVPTNTFDAALAIVRNPAAHVQAVYDANNAAAPFQPALSRAPNDWTMTVTYRGGGLYAPTGLSVDSAGNVWAANYFGKTATKMSVTGIPYAATGFPDSHLNESYGVTVDPQDNAWVSNEELSGVNSGNGSLSKFSSSGTLLSGSGIFGGGLYYPYALAADSDSSIWVPDYGRSGATHYAGDGSSLAGASGFSPSNLPFPYAVSMDGAHNAWFAAQGTAVRMTPAGVTSSYPCCRSAVGIAVDPRNNVWVVDYGLSTLVQLDAGGNVNQRLTTGGVQGPESVYADAAGQAWMTNYRGNTLSAFSAVTATNPTSTALSPATGFGVDAGLNEPFGVAADASGNLWVANFGLDALTQFVGLAAPSKTPVVSLPAAP